MECKHAFVEKETYTIIEAVKKWFHYLSGQKFTIVTGQQVVNYMFYTKILGKKENNKIQLWMMELGCNEYNIIIKNKIIFQQIHSHQLIVALPNNEEKLTGLHTHLYHLGITKLHENTEPSLFY